MLKDRIISTLKFFDLQDTPLTLLELHRFLLADMEELKTHLDDNWEITNNNGNSDDSCNIGQVLKCLDSECKEEVEQKHGYYCLRGRNGLIDLRLGNYLFGIRREKLIKKYLYGVRHAPFLRGVGLVGSQSLGQQKKDSDIDLLILVAPEYMWLARLLITFYFQMTGHRRYGKKIANRFCLNHYLIADKELTFDRNLYTAAEYLKMRPLVYIGGLKAFQSKNGNWIKTVYPNADFKNKNSPDKASACQRICERILSGRFGQWLERQAKKVQYGRINAGEFIVASDHELSFHPNNRKKELFEKFF